MKTTTKVIASSLLVGVSISGVAKAEYVRNDPVNLTDPTGMCPNCVTAGIGGGIGALVNGAAYAFTAGDDFTWGGLAANTAEGALVGATIGSGAGLVTVMGVGAGANIASEAATDASLGAKTGQAEGVFASETVADAAANVMVDGAQGAVAAGVGLKVGVPLGNKIAAGTASAGNTLTQAGSKAYGPALGATAPAVGGVAENLPPVLVDEVFNDSQRENQ